MLWFFSLGISMWCPVILLLAYLFPFFQILNASLLMIPFSIYHIPSFFGPSKYDLKE